MLVSGHCLFLFNSIACYPLFVAIKLNIRFRYMFATKSFKKVRICNRSCQFVLSNGVQILPNFTHLHIQSEWSVSYVKVFQRYKIFSHSYLICFVVYSYGNTVNCCHWNVNSLAAHDYKKVLLLEAHVFQHYDLMFQKHIWNLQYQMMKRHFN